MSPQESDDHDESAAPSADRNVYGGELAPCSSDPETGYLRDGRCRDVDGDVGEHTLCAVMTAEFLEYSRAQGNDVNYPTLLRSPHTGFAR